MSFQSWEELVDNTTASGTAVANTATETILIPQKTIPANYLQAGRLLKLTVYGGYGTTGTPTLTFTLRWGSATGGTVMAKSGTYTTGSGVGGGASMTALFKIEIFIQIRSSGASGTAMSNGEAVLYTTGTAGGTYLPIVSGSTGGTTPAVATLDLTADTALSLTALWGTANAANSIQAHHWSLEALN